MKITEFKIKSLHGFFDYDIKLNEDLTFIYGENGSGKTTVLNMLDNVVSGEIYKLFKYNFKVAIVYYENSDNSNRGEIIVRLKENDEKEVESMTVEFEGDSLEIPRYHVNGREVGFNERNLNYDSEFFGRFELAKKIRETFNYVFLPLNRLSYQNKVPDYTGRINRNRIIQEQDFILNNSNENMSGVRKLVQSSISVINSNINRVNVNFRQRILKSALEIKGLIDLNDFYKYFGNDDIVSELEKTKYQYIELLEELNTITSKEQRENHNIYFDNLIKKVEKSISEKQTSEGLLPPDLIGTYVELIRIRELIKLHEEVNNKIAILQAPINEFLEYTNSFLNNGKDEKQLKITSFGRIYFTTNYTNKSVELEYLSSGEKQIVTFLSNLILKIKKNKFTIFIVDEPELSLHLGWQRKLVETIQKINNNIQIVFATHSPEIVGRYGDKVFELQKNYKPIDTEDSEAYSIEDSETFNLSIELENEFYNLGENDD